MAYLRLGALSLIDRLREPARLIQVIVGPRQVGKTTAVRQAVQKLKFKSVVVSADDPAPPPVSWVSSHWAQARLMARSGHRVILALDELQKIPGWSEAVKKEFDRDARLSSVRRPRVVLLGSSALLVERGLTESLAGRFELIRFSHWGWEEEKKAFGIDCQTHVAMGGYPRLHEFLPDEARFRDYVRNAIIETVLGKDILLLHPVDKPALLRRLFEFACHHPAEILSLQKMMGQLADRGNVTTIAHYLDLLGKAFLVANLQKFSPEILRVRASSPKIVVLATALLAALQDRDSKSLAKEPSLRGRWVENAVGAHLINSGLEVFYWRERDLEVDFVVRRGGKILAIEVGSASKERSPRSLALFVGRYPGAKALVVGPGSGHVSLEDFLGSDPGRWFDIFSNS